MSDPMPVQDRPTELSTRISNLLQGLILAALIGIATLLYDIKEELAQIATNVAVQSKEIEHLNLRLDHHIQDRFAHEGPVGRK